MSDEYLKVEGHTGLVRDNTSKAILNTNKQAYEIAIKRATEARRQK